MKNDKRLVVFCDCGNPFHQIVFEKEEDGAVIVYYQMRHYQGFLGRLKNCWMYLTKKDQNRVDYLDIVLYKEDTLKELKEFIR